MRWVSTDPDEPGVFAFGQFAVGIFAFGQFSLGVVAVGQVARGVLCVGQVAAGVVCVGQLPFGLWHATGMIGVAGRSGFGAILHLLPGMVREPLPALPVAVALPVLESVAGSEGWVACKLASDGLLRGDGARIDASSIAERLRGSAGEGCDRAHVKVSTRAVAATAGYRQAEVRVEVVAVDVIAYRSRPRGHLAYALPFRGKLGRPASRLGLLLRTGGWLLLACIVAVVAFWPLATRLTGHG